MMLKNFRLFEEIHSGMSFLQQEIDRSRLRHSFLVNKSEVFLILTDGYIVLCENVITKIPTHYCKLEFEVKFQVIYQTEINQETLGIPIAIKLERENCTEQLLFSSTTPIIEIWSIQLEKKINQRNFHKLFKAKKKIGKGAFATVYLAQRLRDHKMVAVKAFSKQKQYSGDKGRESLQNEIRLMRQLNHPNIMKLEGVYETDNSIYVILEYLEGAQLQDMLKSVKKLERQEVKSIMENILKGLYHLARNRIIHRDLKPENIMFRKNNCFDLALCDFGLATYAEADKYLFVRCGTPGFVAPEIINIRDMSTKSDPISDVFSAGIIFHHLLFGTSIFEGKKYNQILAQNRACEFNFNKEIYQTINPQCFDLLKKMLEKDPARRISAENALSHSYFLQSIKMEEEPKELFKNILNSPVSPKAYQMKDVEYTPSTFSRQKDEKLSFYEKKKDLKAFLPR